MPGLKSIAAMVLDISVLKWKFGKCAKLPLISNSLTFVKQVTKYKHTAATYILVVMISPEERDVMWCKAICYAHLVPCIQIPEGWWFATVLWRKCWLGKWSLQAHDTYLVYIYSRAVHQMIILIILGFTTNGEWNSLHSKGNTRPLSIFEIQSSVRQKYSQLKVNRLKGMSTPTHE